MKDAWRHAVGTLTAIPVTAPSRVDRTVAGPAMLLAPVAALPLGVAVALVLWAGRQLELAPLAVAFVAVGALALGSRAFHLDGLADTADGLTASYDRERSLAVMRTGDVGPAGTVALVVVLGTQVGALTSLAALPDGPWIAGLLVCVSRGALALTCADGIPSARPDGIGAIHVGSVPRVAAGISWAGLTVIMCVALAIAGESWWRGLICAVAAASVVALLVLRAARRIGGVTGDIFGAAIEISLAALLLAAT